MLTSAQKAAVKADILASSDLNSQPNTPDGAYAIAALYQVLASSAYWVWRTSATKDECVASVSVDGTTFNWTGTGYITRSQGERDAFNALFSVNGAINPSMANVRQAFADIFSGNTAPAPANRTHLLTIARRRANRLEKLLATGAGTTAAPSLMNFEGGLTPQEVEEARNS